MGDFDVLDGEVAQSLAEIGETLDTEHHAQQAKGGPVYDRWSNKKVYR